MTKIYFEELPTEKQFQQLFHKLVHTSSTITEVYSNEGYFVIDENNKIYRIEVIENTTEKISMKSHKNVDFTVYCDYGEIQKTNVHQIPYDLIKVKKTIYVFRNKEMNSLLNLVVEKETGNDSISDIYCSLKETKNVDSFKSFYEELKEYNDIIYV